jgi:uncharacterized membrane protein YtjA (UPF0391 family)
MTWSVVAWSRRQSMLSWPVTFFIISLVAAVLGLRGIGGLAEEVGYLFAVFAVIFLVVAVFTGRPVAPSP